MSFHVNGCPVIRSFLARAAALWEESKAVITEKFASMISEVDATHGWRCRHDEGLWH